MWYLSCALRSHASIQKSKPIFSKQSCTMVVTHCHWTLLRLQGYSSSIKFSFMKEAKVCVQSLKELFFITGNALAVCRGTWFTGSGAPELWQPIVEEDAEQIEMSHQTIWRSMVSPDWTKYCVEYCKSSTCKCCRSASLGTYKNNFGSSKVLVLI